MIGPYAAVASSTGRPVGGLAGRLELRRLPAKVGYKVVYAPTVRLLRVVDGGIAGADGSSGARRAPRRRPRGARRRRRRTRPSSRPLEVGSPLLARVRRPRRPARAPAVHRPVDRRTARAARRASRSSSPRAARTRAGGSAATPAAWRRRSGTTSASRSSATRRGSTGSSGAPTSSPAPPTSARSAPASPTRRSSGRSPRVGLEHGWVRGYLLYLRDEPIAYWLCSTYRDTILIRTAGYDPKLRRAPRRHLPAHAGDRGRLRRPRPPQARLRARATPRTSSSSRARAGRSGTWSSSRRPSAAAGLNATRTRDPRAGAGRPQRCSTRPASPTASRRGGGTASSRGRYRCAAEALDDHPAGAEDRPERRSATSGTGRPLGGTIRTRYAHLGANDVGNADYDDLALLFAGIACRPGRRDRRRRLRQGAVAQLVPRPLPGNEHRRDRARPRHLRRDGEAAPPPRERRDPLRRRDGAAPVRTGRSSTSSTRSTSR